MKNDAILKVVNENIVNEIKKKKSQATMFR